MTKEELFEKAVSAMKNAYAPYSHFFVGAALLAESGRVYTGANMENATYGATVCAERSAFCAAVSAGEREFCALFVVGGKEGKPEKECTPCGICRQTVSEFCDEDFLIYTTDGKNIFTRKAADLLPLAFKTEE